MVRCMTVNVSVVHTDQTVCRWKIETFTIASFVFLSSVHVHDCVYVHTGCTCICVYVVCLCVFVMCVHVCVHVCIYFCNKLCVCTFMVSLQTQDIIHSQW